MKKNLMPKVLFWLSVSGLAVASASFMFMPIAAVKAAQGRWWQILSGFMFWIPFVVGYSALVFLNLRRRRDCHDGQLSNGIRRWGILRASTGVFGRSMDVVFFLSLAGFLLFVFLWETNYFTFIFFSLAVFTLQLRCVLNGVNYQYIKNLNSGFDGVQQEG